MKAGGSQVTIVGGGLAGMRCAELLGRNGFHVVLVEREDRLGGRVRTEEIDGFYLDRGFQVLLTEYPEARQALDFDALDLRHFEPGAIVRYGDGFHRLSDPLRRPAHIVDTLRAPLGSLADKLRILRMRLALTRLSESEILSRDETTTIDALRHRWGFSTGFIESFFRPFLGGILLDASLSGSSRMTEYVFSLFSSGTAAVPAHGMGRIADQLAARLTDVEIRLNTEVRAIDAGGVTLDDGTVLPSDVVVVAVDGPEANRLFESGVSPDYVGTHCHYFVSDQAPLNEPVLVLNGEGSGPINNLCVMTNVAPDYSATQEALISVTVLDRADHPLETEPEAGVRNHLSRWFGPIVQHWRHIRSYHIATALPDQAPPFLSATDSSPRVRDSIFRCGDYLDTASINGALRSGRRAAEAIIAEISPSSS